MVKSSLKEIFFPNEDIAKTELDFFNASLGGVLTNDERYFLERMWAKETGEFARYGDFIVSEDRNADGIRIVRSCFTDYCLSKAGIDAISLDSLASLMKQNLYPFTGRHVSVLDWLREQKFACVRYYDNIAFRWLETVSPGSECITLKSEHDAIIDWEGDIFCNNYDIPQREIDCLNDCIKGAQTPEERFFFERIKAKETGEFAPSADLLISEHDNADEIYFVRYYYTEYKLGSMRKNLDWTAYCISFEDLLNEDLYPLLGCHLTIIEWLREQKFACVGYNGNYALD